MCTAATYKTKDFYFGRTLDYEFSYGDEVVITPRNYPFHFRHIDAIESHYAMIGMAHVVDNDPLYYDAFNECGLAMAGLNFVGNAAYYDIEEYTDQTLRQLAEETIREKALKLLKDEVPHGIYVEVEKMKLRNTTKGEEIYDVDATIYCLRNSHKGIIIGKNGAMLKRIVTSARMELEKMLGTKLNLKVWVKVKEDWQDKDSIVKKFKFN